MEKHKKCKMCYSDAKFVWEGSYYCKVCLRSELEVMEQNMPHICEMCGNPLDDVYYADLNSDPFCSLECALEYNGAVLVEEEDDDESGN